MADVSSDPIPYVVGHPLGFNLFSHRRLCQVEAARILMNPAEYSTYLQITMGQNRVNFGQFQRQLDTLFERPDKDYRHLQTYWDVNLRAYIEGTPVEDDPLYYYPIYLHGRLLGTPDYIYPADPEQSNRIRARHRIEANRINMNIHLAFHNIVRAGRRV